MVVMKMLFHVCGARRMDRSRENHVHKNGCTSFGWMRMLKSSL